VPVSPEKLDSVPTGRIGHGEHKGGSTDTRRHEAPGFPRYGIQKPDKGPVIFARELREI
jgi:hypothetical protein